VLYGTVHIHSNISATHLAVWRLVALAINDKSSYNSHGVA